MHEASVLPDAPVGIVAGQPVYKTRDLDYVAFLLATPLYMIMPTEDRVAKPIDARVRLADLVPFSDSDATSPAKSIRYTFVLQSKDADETEAQLCARMRNLELSFLNKQVLVEPVGFGAWRRQLRSWMTETDGRRRLMLDSMQKRTR